MQNNVASVHTQGTPDIERMCKEMDAVANKYGYKLVNELTLISQSQSLMHQCGLQFTTYKRNYDPKMFY